MKERKTLSHINVLNHKVLPRKTAKKQSKLRENGKEKQKTKRIISCGKLVTGNLKYIHFFAFLSFRFGLNYNMLLKISSFFPGCVAVLCRSNAFSKLFIFPSNTTHSLTSLVLYCTVNSSESKAKPNGKTPNIKHINFVSFHNFFVVFPLTM